MSGDDTKTPAQTESPGPMKTGRDMYWSELTDDKKLERMRGVVKRHADSIMRLEKTVRELTHRVQNHHHLPDGKAAMSIFRDDQSLDFFHEKTQPIDLNKVYF